MQKYGGISRYFWQLMEGIAKVSPQTELGVLAPAYLNQYLHSTSSMRVHGCRAPKFPGAERALRSLNQTITSAALKGLHPSVVHETYYYYSQRSHLAPATKCVITVHDMIPEKFPQHFSPHDPTPAQKARAVKLADHVICVSRRTQADLMEILGVPPEKTSVIYHGASWEESALPPEAPQNYLLYVGPREGYKNFTLLLRAYAASLRLKNQIPIVCVGGEPPARSELALARSLGIHEGNLRYVTANDQELRGLYRKATIFIYTSLYEGFGMPPLEAMRMGCPVICSTGGSLGEVAGAGALTFDPTHQESLTAAIEEVLESKEKRDALIARGTAHSKQFGWESCARETLSVYGQVCGIGRA